MKICLKWVHMARYGLILRLERALWLRIIFRPLLTPKGAIKIKKKSKEILKSVPNQPSKSALKLNWLVSKKKDVSSLGRSSCLLHLGWPVLGKEAVPEKLPAYGNRHLNSSNSSGGPNRVNRAHWPTKENRQNFGIFWIFSVHGKNGLRWPQIGPGGFFSY